ncbi:hypothetical protein AURDEDRAFT_149849 [Auricularia subglabra TFB-10046 SS5]|nr:hypothetical protein AURDEDRAFT_149849 [Auricularia subglabra TFB-10046 SS5]
MLSAEDRRFIVRLIQPLLDRMSEIESKVQQVRERMDAMTQTFDQLNGGVERIYTNSRRRDVALGYYLNDIHDAVCGQEAPDPAATSQATLVAGAASTSDDSSSLHTLDFAAQQDEIVAGGVAVIDPNAVVEPPAAMPDAGLAFDSPFDNGIDDFMPKEEPETTQTVVDFMRSSSPVERKAVPPPPPPLPTPAATSSPHRRDFPARKTRSQTTSTRNSLSVAPRGRSTRSTRSPLDRLSAVPSVSSPLAGPSGSRFTSTLSPSPEPSVKLDPDNPSPKALRVKTGLVALAASLPTDTENEYEDFEVPDECFAPPTPVPAAPVPVRMKQPSAPAKRGRKRIKVDEDAQNEIAQATVLWPALITDPDHLTTVQCDRCFVWYHLGCVGFAADVVLAEEERFECPPCCAEIRQGKDVDPTRAIKAESRVQHCARSDCWQPRMEVDEFFIECIIGRRPSAKVEGDIEYYMKWEGYPIDEATWQPPDTLPVHIGPRLIKEFEEQAKREGIDVEDENDEIVLNAVHLSKARALGIKKSKAD